MKKYFKLMRIKHYVKNALILVPLFFHGSLLDNEKLKAALLGMLVFSLLSSVIYILNDIQDREKDRLHPTKRLRPIASGEISVKNAYICMGVIFAAMITVNIHICRSLNGNLCILLYLLLNVFYSRGLKNYPIIDITILASGFLLRILYGAAITQIRVSSWLYLTVVTIAFYFVLGKRRNELKQQKDNSTRSVLNKYSLSFLDKHMYLCLALGIMFYSMWTMESHNQMLVFSVPLVLLICMRYNLTVEADSDGDPVEVLLGDKILLAMCLLFGVFMLGVFYI